MRGGFVRQDCPQSGLNVTNLFAYWERQKQEFCEVLVTKCKADLRQLLRIPGKSCHQNTTTCLTLKKSRFHHEKVRGPLLCNIWS